MNIANKVTTFRFLVIPFFIAALLYYKPERDYLRFVALGIFMLAVVSDGLDGYLARIRKEQTKVGSILDPLADKLLLVISLVCLYVIRNNFPQNVQLPLWFVLVAITRDVLIILGSSVVYIAHAGFDVIPSKMGKLTTFFQMLVVIAILINFAFSNIIWYFAAIFTVLSGLGYLRRGQRLLNQ